MADGNRLNPDGAQIAHHTDLQRHLLWPEGQKGAAYRATEKDTDASPAWKKEARKRRHSGGFSIDERHIGDRSAVPESLLKRLFSRSPKKRETSSRDKKQDPDSDHTGEPCRDKTVYSDTLCRYNKIFQLLEPA